MRVHVPIWVPKTGMFLHYMIQSYALGSPVVLVPYWVFVVMREAKKGLGIGAQSTGDGGDKNTRSMRHVEQDGGLVPFLLDTLDIGAVLY